MSNQDEIDRIHQSFSIMQDDIGLMLHALGLHTGARNCSPHEVCINEIIPAIYKLKEALDSLPKRARNVDYERMDAEERAKPGALHFERCGKCGHKTYFTARKP